MKNRLLYLHFQQAILSVPFFLNFSLLSLSGIRCTTGNLENVDRVHLTILVPPTDVLVDVGRFLASVLAMGTLETWLLAALVSQMTVQRGFLAVGTGAVRTRELLRLKVIV